MNFEPPVAGRWTFADGARNPGERRYWSYYGLQSRGRSVLKIAGTWTVMDLPTTTQINATDRIVNTHGETVPGYLAGGHITPVTPTVAAELTAAGLGAYLS